MFLVFPNPPNLDTKYDVVKFVGKKIFKWILQYEIDGTNWDIFWTDAAVSTETLGKCNVSHLIEILSTSKKLIISLVMYSLARKNHLGKKFN